MNPPGIIPIGLSTKQHSFAWFLTPNAASLGHRIPETQIFMPPLIATGIVLRLPFAVKRWNVSHGCTLLLHPVLDAGTTCQVHQRYTRYGFCELYETKRIASPGQYEHYMPC